MQKIKTPTGYIIVDEYSKGKLETLSIGDYGKKHNIKADFLGFHKEIDSVPCDIPVNLSEKWVMTLSTQYGCPMKCKFCDVPKIPFHGNVSPDDFIKQIQSARECFPEVKYTDRLNIHFARMGEPAFNASAIFDTCTWLESKKNFQDILNLRVETIHPVFTTSMPQMPGTRLYHILDHWCGMKNSLYKGQAGLQLSINSTNEVVREEIFGHKVFPLDDIAEIVACLPDPLGRKYCLNFLLADGWPIDAQLLKSMFDSNKFMVKLTPAHNCNACKESGIRTVDGLSSYSPYRKIEGELKEAGFDVIVFIPSLDEEVGKITCGNAVLSGVSNEAV